MFCLKPQIVLLCDLCKISEKLNVSRYETAKGEQFCYAIALVKL